MTSLLNGLVTLTSIRLSSLSAGPNAMRIAVVFTDTDTVPILSKSIGRDRPQYRERSRRIFAVVFSGMCWQCLHRTRHKLRRRRGVGAMR